MGPEMSYGVGPKSSQERGARIGLEASSAPPSAQLPAETGWEQAQLRMGLGSRAEPKWAPGAWVGGHSYCCSGLWVLPGQLSLLEGLLSSPPLLQHRNA